MLMGSIPVQTITDLADMAKLVEALKDGKAAKLLSELQTGMKDMKKEEKGHASRLIEIDSKLEELSKKESSLQGRETRLKNERDSFALKKAEGEEFLLTAQQKSEIALNQYEEAKKQAAKINKDLDARILRTERSEIEATRLHAEAKSLKEECENKIKRITAAAEA